jgi:branched-chain amino acid transport system ATP-binding protein
MPDALLSTHGLVKRYGGLVATDHVSLGVLDGEIHAVIGPNGAGKTTLVAQLAGEIRPDSGTIRFAGQDITRLRPHARAARGLARSFQITSVLAPLTALDNVALAAQAQAGHSFRFWRAAATDPALRQPARAVLDRVGLGARAGTAAGTLSHGERRALDIAMALAGQPKLLLLDEPMAGMGADDSARMVQLLYSLKGQVTILLVEHDMDAVFALADRITVLVYGRVIATGRPDAIRRDLAVREAYLGDAEAA